MLCCIPLSLSLFPVSAQNRALLGLPRTCGLGLAWPSVAVGLTLRVSKMYFRQQWRETAEEKGSLWWRMLRALAEPAAPAWKSGCQHWAWGHSPRVALRVWAHGQLWQGQGTSLKWLFDPVDIWSRGTWTDFCLSITTLWGESQNGWGFEVAAAWPNNTRLGNSNMWVLLLLWSHRLVRFANIRVTQGQK